MSDWPSTAWSFLSRHGRLWPTRIRIRHLTEQGRLPFVMARLVPTGCAHLGNDAPRPSLNIVMARLVRIGVKLAGRQHNGCYPVMDQAGTRSAMTEVQRTFAKSFFIRHLILAAT